jgi:hypothetical protein
MKLWLDDERPAPKGWVLAKTANEAIRHLENMRKAPEKPDEPRTNRPGCQVCAICRAMSGESW